METINFLNVVMFALCGGGTVWAIMDDNPLGVCLYTIAGLLNFSAILVNLN